MGLFDKLVAKLIAGMASALPPDPAPAPTPATPVASQRTASGLIVTFTGPAGPTIEVSDAEVTERAYEHAFVLTTDPPKLKTADEWWNEDTHKRRRREGSEKAYAWLLPFVPMEVAKLEQLKAAQDWGPHSASWIAKELRALIRERRKSKEPYGNLLKALYGACVAADVATSLTFEGVGCRIWPSSSTSANLSRFNWTTR